MISRIYSGPGYRIYFKKAGLAIIFKLRLETCRPDGCQEIVCTSSPSSVKLDKRSRSGTTAECERNAAMLRKLSSYRERIRALERAVRAAAAGRR